MERIPVDETLILDGILRRDDSDRIGQLTRRVQAFQQAQGALHTTLMNMLTRVSEAVTTTFGMLQHDIETAFTDVQTQLAALNTQAVELSLDLETLLTKTGASQVTQAELDALDAGLQATTATVQHILDRTQGLSTSDDDLSHDEEMSHG